MKVLHPATTVAMSGGKVATIPLYSSTIVCPSMPSGDSKRKRKPTTTEKVLEEGTTKKKAMPWVTSTSDHPDTISSTSGVPNTMPDSLEDDT